MHAILLTGLTCYIRPAQKLTEATMCMPGTLMHQQLKQHICRLWQAYLLLLYVHYYVVECSEL